MNLAVDGTFDLNGYAQNFKDLSGNGKIILNGGILTVGSSSFRGEFRGPGTVKLSNGEVLYCDSPEKEDDRENNLGASMKF